MLEKSLAQISLKEDQLDLSPYVEKADYSFAEFTESGVFVGLSMTHLIGFAVGEKVP